MGKPLSDELEDEKLNRIMCETVDHIVGGHFSDAADGLYELAKYFARAGMPQHTFEDIRKHLLDSASQKTGCPVFAREHLTQAERELSDKRKSIIIH